MTPHFDFVVDKEKKAIYITREFAADRDIVWDAFTKPEILEQWIAPKPLTAKIKEMDFRVGGRSITMMIKPDNVPVPRLALAEFIKIDPKSSFATKNSFLDEDEQPIGNGSSITTNFFDATGADKTTVRIEKLFDSLATVEMMATSGFKEGMELAVQNLDDYLRNMVVAR